MSAKPTRAEKAENLYVVVRVDSAQIRKYPPSPGRPSNGVTRAHAESLAQHAGGAAPHYTVIPVEAARFAAALDESVTPERAVELYDAHVAELEAAQGEAETEEAGS